MIIKTKKTIASSEITDPHLFKQRREIIKALLASAVSGSSISSAFAAREPDWKGLPKVDVLSKTEIPTPIKLVKNYTNITNSL